MALEFHTIPELLEDEDYQGFWAGAVSPSGRYVLINKYRSIWVLDRTDESYITAFAPDALDTYSSVAIDDDGTIYAIANPSVVFGSSALVKIEDFGRGTMTALAEDLLGDSPRSLGLFVMPDDSKKLVWAELGDDKDVKVYTIGVGLATVSNGGAVAYRQTLQDSYGDVWAVTSTSSHVIFQRVVDGGAGTAAPDYNSVDLGVSVSVFIEAYHSASGWFVNFGGGEELFLLDDADFSILEQRTYAADSTPINSIMDDVAPFLLGLAPGAASFWYPGPNSYADYFYSDLHKINAADLTSLVELDVTDWIVGDEPDPTPGLIYSTYGRVALISGSLGAETTPTIPDYTTVLRYFAEAEGGEGGGGGVTDESVRLRVWGFSLDGHDHIVFRLGPSESLVYDPTTGKWAHWASPNRENWRAHVGQNWVGMSADTIANGFGSDVVAGDDVSGTLYILSPTAGRDDDPTTGEPIAFNRKIIGGLSVSGRDVLSCGAVTLDLSVGAPVGDGAVITLRTSDDFGHNFTSHGSLIVAADDFGQVVEWRSLGLIKAPGRVFEISDNGAAVRVSAANMR